ncbi:hypothetical protein PR048_019834 [Dryococelus australis]|uniref:Mutator-like transposase domain-containing protein n=1 Tax=Dryococelus australis TaxID=614101 RepID=A0ABQ9H4K2_9NEOP|nr:hypothetical protein PR048_019834 [Dryococelus australis]
MQCMSNKAFLKHMKKVSEAIDDAALPSMLDAAEEEKAIAIRDGNVDCDRVPMCTVVADGVWCKRSYKTNYDSLSTIYCIFVSIIFASQVSNVGFKTGTVPHICVRNRYCSICPSCQNAKQTPPSHACFLDWNKSATSMEADIIADGFLQSEKLLGLKFNKLISEILTVCKVVGYTMPCGPNIMVEKVECKNHVLHDYCHKLTALTKNTKLPVTSRNLSKKQIPIFRTAVDKAIKFRAAGNEQLNTRICMLKADVYNSPLHIFGDHEHCDVYFCNGNNEGEINYVPGLKSCGLLQEIIKIICGSVSGHVSSLIADQNNLSESFNSIINKHVARKRINYALRGQYKMRCSTAAV